MGHWPLERRRPESERVYPPGLFLALNGAIRRQRRRLVMLAVVLALAGAVVTVHSTTTHDHIGDVVVMCLAVAETAVVAVGAAVAFGAHMRRPPWPAAAPHAPKLRFISAAVGVQARAGPPRLQVFRL